GSSPVGSSSAAGLSNELTLHGLYRRRRRVRCGLAVRNCAFRCALAADFLVGACFRAVWTCRPAPKLPPENKTSVATRGRSFLSAKWVPTSLCVYSPPSHACPHPSTHRSWR